MVDIATIFTTKSMIDIILFLAVAEIRGIRYFPSITQVESLNSCLFRVYPNALMGNAFSQEPAHFSCASRSVRFIFSSEDDMISSTSCLRASSLKVFISLITCVVIEWSKLEKSLAWTIMASARFLVTDEDIWYSISAVSVGFGIPIPPIRTGSPRIYLSWAEILRPIRAGISCSLRASSSGANRWLMFGIVLWT